MFTHKKEILSLNGFWEKSKKGKMFPSPNYFLASSSQKKEFVQSWSCISFLQYINYLLIFSSLDFQSGGCNSRSWFEWKKTFIKPWENWKIFRFGFENGRTEEEKINNSICLKMQLKMSWIVNSILMTIFPT